jgi:RNA polymerase sigma-70 factor (ECF subfamily)
MEFERVINGCINNDRKCQKQLFDSYYAYGLKISLAFSNDLDCAREILNDAFIKVFDNLSQFDKNQPFLPWFKTIIIRTSINHFHKTNRWIKTSPITELSESLIDHNHFLYNLESNELLLLVQKLPPQYRMVLNLYTIEGFGHKEIADMLKISEGTSKSNLSKARAFLKKLMSEIKIFSLI